MADLTIVASEFTALNVPLVEQFAGVNLVPGDQVYLDTTAQWQLAQCDGSEVESEVRGTVSVTAAAGQLCPVVIAGVVVLGASSGVVAGTLYVLSNTAGRVMPAADLVTTGWYSSVVGVGGENNAMHVLPFPSTEVVP